MKNLDFGHLMLDMQTKDFLEDVTDERRNKNEDLILDEIDAAWKFRCDRIPNICLLCWLDSIAVIK